MREELEDYLKDDDDMAKMSLTRKREQALAWAAAQRARSPSALLKPYHEIFSKIHVPSEVHLGKINKQHLHTLEVAAKVYFRFSQQGSVRTALELARG